MDKQFRTWFDRFGEEAANTEDDARIKAMLLEATEYVGMSADAPVEEFVEGLGSLTEDPNFAGTGVYITALVQRACDAGVSEVKIDFAQLGETPRHLASYLRGNPEQKPDIILYGNLYDGVAGVGVENVTLHMAGYTGVPDAIMIGGDGKYGLVSYGAAMHARNSSVIFRDQEYNSASGFMAEDCEFIARVEPDRTLNQIHGRSGKGCTFFQVTDQGEVYELS